MPRFFLLIDFYLSQIDTQAGKLKKILKNQNILDQMNLLNLY